MALMHINFYSDTLRIDVGMDVIYPQNTTRTPSELRDIIRPPYQVLYLLHGIMRNQTSWTRFTSIERYVMDMGLVVVMPTTGRGMYINQVNGYNYFDFFSKELPEIISKMFQVSTEREDTFVAGLSMGGYGALKLGIECSEIFSYAASLSGGVRIENMMSTDSGVLMPGEPMLSFGNTAPKGGKDDIFEAIQRRAQAGDDLPKLFLSCGYEDPFFQDNVDFYHHARQYTDVTYLEEAGAHTWEFWDRNVQKILEWLPIKQRIRDYEGTFIV